MLLGLLGAFAIGWVSGNGLFTGWAWIIWLACREYPL